ncbi:MAG TPA: nuclear transport factor 2 family protein [Terracidiphilus sp.]
MARTSHFFACMAAFLFACTAFAQAPPANVTSTDEAVVAEFQKLENRWDDAVNLRDQYALELALSPLYVDISASGDITTRNQQVASLLSGDDKTIHLEQKIITVRVMGDVAVANGTYTLHHKALSGPVDEKGVFTHVFQHVRAGWVCINSQRTMVREESAGKHKKPSTAEQPFHIPLFSKSDKDKQ